MSTPVCEFLDVRNYETCQMEIWLFHLIMYFANKTHPIMCYSEAYCGKLWSKENYPNPPQTPTITHLCIWLILLWFYINRAVWEGGVSICLHHRLAELSCTSSFPSLSLSFLSMNYAQVYFARQFRMKWENVDICNWNLSYRVLIFVFLLLCLFFIPPWHFINVDNYQ